MGKAREQRLKLETMVKRLAEVSNSISKMITPAVSAGHYSESVHQLSKAGLHVYFAAQIILRLLGREMEEG